ncbi:hypothetical protein ACIQLK_13310 [Microbacterium sp. NPDC091382]|uniref:hypothetical protein n=1 Tax=Microbacterium sp. NPDC091382 TaxID=3364210 RepID=UPI00382D525F
MQETIDPVAAAPVEPKTVAPPVITPWHVLGVWAVVSLVLLFAHLPFFWLAVPTAVAAVISRRSGHGHLWWLYASAAAGLVAMFFAFSSLLTYSVSY